MANAGEGSVVRGGASVSPVKLLRVGAAPPEGRSPARLSMRLPQGDSFTLTKETSHPHGGRTWKGREGLEGKAAKASVVAGGDVRLIRVGRGLGKQVCVCGDEYGSLPLSWVGKDRVPLGAWKLCANGL